MLAKIIEVFVIIFMDVAFLLIGILYANVDGFGKSSYVVFGLVLLMILISVVNITNICRHTDTYEWD